MGRLVEEEDFVDILEERRRSSDLGHAFRTFNPQPYKGAPPSSIAELNNGVLESQYLRYVAKEVRLIHLTKRTVAAENMSSIHSPHSFSDRHGDGFIGGEREKGGRCDFGRNVSKPAVGLYQADGLHTHQGVQEALQEYLRQHGGTQYGQKSVNKL